MVHRDIGGEIASIVEAGASDEDTQIVCPRDHWITVLTHRAIDHGFSAFVLWGAPTGPRLRTFIAEIAPAVKERVAARRGDGVPPP